ARRERLAERFGRRHRGEPRDDRRRTLDVGGERLRLGTAGAFAALHQGESPGGETGECARELLQALDAHGLQVVTERGLDGALPARFDFEIRREPRPRGEARTAQPLGGRPRMIRERRRLQRLGRGELAARRFARAARALEALLAAELRGAQRLHPRLRLGERARAPLARATRLGFLERELAELRAALLRAETEPLSGEPFGLRPKLPQLVLELLDAGTLDLGGLLRPARRPRVLFPALLPLLERLLARLERRAGALLGLLRGLALGREPRDLPAHRGVVHLAAAVEVPQAQRQELRGEASLLLLQRLVAPGGRRLTLQVPDLLLHLVAHVLEPLEILAGLGDARLGLLAPLLVARDTGGFLDEGAHVLALRLDDARDRALLDDGVAARAEPR